MDKYEIPTARLIFEGANASNQAQGILLGLWAKREDPSAEETTALLTVALRLAGVAEELDCRRRGRGALHRRG